MKIRLEGVALLALCALALHRIYLLVHGVPVHQATPVELALGVVAVVTGVIGAVMLAVGPPLFRHYAWPPTDGD
jgi:hypothetical protein